MFALSRRVAASLAAVALATGAAGCGGDEEEPLEEEGIEQVEPEEGVIEEEE
jgi:O-acetyl-ADP-ribose deacetylase (regulator of RNase III)